MWTDRIPSAVRRNDSYVLLIISMELLGAKGGEGVLGHGERPRLLMTMIVGFVLLSAIPFSIGMLQCYPGALCCLIITFLMKGLSYWLHKKEMVGAI